MISKLLEAALWNSGKVVEAGVCLQETRDRNNAQEPHMALRQDLGKLQAGHLEFDSCLHILRKEAGGL